MGEMNLDDRQSHVLHTPIFIPLRKSSSRMVTGRGLPAPSTHATLPIEFHRWFSRGATCTAAQEIIQHF